MSTTQCIIISTHYRLHGTSTTAFHKGRTNLTYVYTTYKSAPSPRYLGSLVRFSNVLGRPVISLAVTVWCCRLSVSDNTFLAATPQFCRTRCGSTDPILLSFHWLLNTFLRPSFSNIERRHSVLVNLTFLSHYKNLRIKWNKIQKVAISAAMPIEATFPVTRSPELNEPNCAQFG